MISTYADVDISGLTLIISNAPLSIGRNLSVFRAYVHGHIQYCVDICAWTHSILCWHVHGHIQYCVDIIYVHGHIQYCVDICAWTHSILCWYMRMDTFNIVLTYVHGHIQYCVDICAWTHSILCWHMCMDTFNIVLTYVHGYIQYMHMFSMSFQSNSSLEIHLQNQASIIIITI